MSPRTSRRFHRRTALRRDRRLQALVGPKHSPSERCENAVVEEVSKEGVRVRSGAPLRPDDSFFLYVGDKPKPLSAKVVWVRKEGLIEKRQTGKAGQAFVAGCRLRPDKQPREAKPRAAARHAGTADRITLLIRATFVAGGVGLLGLIVYALVALARLM